MTRIAYLGPSGTYTHQAAIQQFGVEDNEMIPMVSIQKCFSALLKDESISYAVLPAENSTNGQVVFTYDLLRDYMLETPNAARGCMLPGFAIVAEQYVAVEHCLASPLPMTADELKNANIERIYSHPQVWGQVGKYLEELARVTGKALSRCDAGSTSQAVDRCLRDYREDKTVTLAIASALACRISGAHIVQSHISDVADNTTRFLIIQRRKQEPLQILPGRQPTPSGERIHLVAFTTDRQGAGSLTDVLLVLKRYGIDMRSITSRPFRRCSTSSKWQYVFFVEYSDELDVPWDSFHAEVGAHCREWCHWGTFYRNNRYYS
ncbi:FADL180Cp [Eremothecium gossypii FDAG1]|nr:FADL180Cp [Eremothecium gossypii FDAG1]